MFVPPTKSRLSVSREGHSIARIVPKPVVIIDTREQRPFTFKTFGNWIDEIVYGMLPTGDYSVAGMQELLALERKSLPDVILSLTEGRERFLRECERLAGFRHKAILIEASYEAMKSPYHEYTNAHPNGITGSLDAIEARYGIPIIYTSAYRELAEEKTASWLSKHFTYWWLESNGFGRWLVDGDL